MVLSENCKRKRIFRIAKLRSFIWIENFHSSLSKFVSLSITGLIYKGVTVIHLQLNKLSFFYVQIFAVLLFIFCENATNYLLKCPRNLSLYQIRWFPFNVIHYRRNQDVVQENLHHNPYSRPRQLYIRPQYPTLLVYHWGGIASFTIWNTFRRIRGLSSWQ